jgi:hypothetical protein
MRGGVVQWWTARQADSARTVLLESRVTEDYVPLVSRDREGAGDCYDVGCCVRFLTVAALICVGGKINRLNATAFAGARVWWQSKRDRRSTTTGRRTSKSRREDSRLALNAPIRQLM